MALRVLLADESSTIKKVFQLALQDYAVDVRPVNLGIDVLPVARSFKPDIVFADILLQKQNGYDVAVQLKQDPDFANLPVVLMWSGFMELDEDKLQASRADASLEKPFDVNQLRTLINQLVPKTQGNRLSQYLNFPKMPEFKEEAPVTPPPTAAEEDFKQVPLQKMKGKDKYRVDIQPTDDVNDIPVSYDIPNGKIEVESLLGNEEPEEFAVHSPKRPPPPPSDAAMDLSVDTRDPDEMTKSHIGLGHTVSRVMQKPAETTMVTATHNIPQLSAEELENIVRQQSREVIEAVAWKIVPDLATQIIERELARLLKERETNPY